MNKNLKKLYEGINENNMKVQHFLNGAFQSYYDFFKLVGDNQSPDGINSYVLASGGKGLVSLLTTSRIFLSVFFFLRSHVTFLNLSELPYSFYSFTGVLLSANLFLFLTLSHFFLRLLSSLVTTSLLCFLI